MIKEIKEKFPSWVNDTENYDLVVGDDIDSVLVSNFLENMAESSTRYFYDFKDLYIEKDYENEKKVIGCDIDFTFASMRSWGNHVTAISSQDYISKNSANLNNIEKVSSNYTAKYAGSTFATVLSYYNYDVSKLSDEAKMLIMAIDSHYIGFYTSFHLTQKKWLVDVLEFKELYDVIRENEKEDFEQLQAKYNLKHGKVWINEDRFLETDIDIMGISEVLKMDITLPTCQFTNYFKDNLELKTGYARTDNINNKNSISKNIFSYSQTYRNNASYTYLVQI